MGKTEAPQLIPVGCFNSLPSLPPSVKRDIPPQLVKKTVAWLKPKGIKYFRDIKKKYGRIDAAWVESKEYTDEQEGRYSAFPHLVHFREGMQVRNFMRSTKLCKGWDCHDYDNNWCRKKCILFPTQKYRFSLLIRGQVVVGDLQTACRVPF